MDILEKEIQPVPFTMKSCIGYKALNARDMDVVDFVMNIYLETFDDLDEEFKPDPEGHGEIFKLKYYPNWFTATNDCHMFKEEFELDKKYIISQVFNQAIQNARVAVISNWSNLTGAKLSMNLDQILSARKDFKDDDKKFLWLKRWTFLSIAEIFVLITCFEGDFKTSKHDGDDQDGIFNELHDHWFKNTKVIEEMFSGVKNPAQYLGSNANILNFTILEELSFKYTHHKYPKMPAGGDDPVLMFYFWMVYSVHTVLGFSYEAFQAAFKAWATYISRVLYHTNEFKLSKMLETFSYFPKVDYYKKDLSDKEKEGIDYLNLITKFIRVSQGELYDQMNEMVKVDAEKMREEQLDHFTYGKYSYDTVHEPTETETTLFDLTDILRMFASEKELYEAMLKVAKEDPLSDHKKEVIDHITKFIAEKY